MIFTLGSATSYLLHTIIMSLILTLITGEGTRKGSRLKSHGCGPHKMRLGIEDTSVTSKVFVAFALRAAGLGTYGGG